MNSNIKIVSGVTMTPPAIGRIMMGHTELRGNGESAKAIPQKDDHFTVTTLTQKSDRSWVEHPIVQKIANGKSALTSIPVRIAYNDPNLSLHNRYSVFDNRTGRPVCSGDGVKARCITAEGVKTVDCPRPEACEFGQKNRCKSMTRFYVRIDGQEDELGLFVLRSTSFNTLERLAGRLARLHGISGGCLAGMPLLLTINAKTSAQSFRTVFWFADLVQRPGMTLAQTVTEARNYQAELAECGLSQEGLEEAARLGLANGDFADELEEIEEWLSDDEMAEAAERNLLKSGLRGLDSLAAAVGGVAANSASADSPSADDGVPSGDEVSSDLPTPTPALETPNATISTLAKVPVAPALVRGKPSFRPPAMPREAVLAAPRSGRAAA